MKSSPKPAKHSLSAGKFSQTVSRKYNMEYLLYLPEGYSTKTTKRWALMLFLHGAGERGSTVQKVAVHGPPKMAKEGHKFPFIIVAPQCPKEELWSNESLMDLLDYIEGNFLVDESRIYVSGLSMGGYGTWNLAMNYPERFAAVVPICGGGEILPILLARDHDPNKLAAMKTLGIWVFHGGKDPSIPVDESERLVTLLRKAGCKNVKLTVYPEADHDSWTEAYDNPELYDWLLKHERRP